MPGRIRQEPSRRSSRSSSSSDYRDSSDYSVSTASTDESVRPSLQQYRTSGNPYKKNGWEEFQHSYLDDGGPRVSTETYASSVSSMDDLDQAEDLPPYDVPDDGYRTVAPKALAASPQEFAEYFPSSQRLCIRHDDSTMDGNMNLRVDTKARTYDGGDVDLTLFHLRMHDLKRREFSLRRYCRDSGREVCHSSRKYSQPSVVKRPGIQQSMSNALSTFRSKPDHEASTMPSLKRNDSGYGSIHKGEVENEVETLPAKTPSVVPIPTNTTRLEFSNYAHLEVRRRGTKSSKKYEFEYWGTKYAWKRIAVASGNFKEISYHLYDTKTSASLAHIVPVPQSSSEQREEDAKGGWVPPCAMMLEESVGCDSADLAE